MAKLTEVKTEITYNFQLSQHELHVLRTILNVVDNTNALQNWPDLLPVMKSIHNAAYGR